ncbi:ETC complex I subunit [Paracoccus onubensis]|uniref:NADH dehydrogenase ubiquinone Fe-S protein 4 n=1 Tax=Paracoccus onubensis TaxID=1675788 RepID=UPI0027311442|nr:NADH dehydrogenase ubiquinone Fe-S protein 4 [Paracoccus onubensis]MDP0928477.1 ETC complex I subunit [Paracoccus onubensis]
MNIMKGEFLSADGFTSGPAQNISGPDWASSLPMEATARIWKPSKSTMTSGRGCKKGWKMAFPRRRGVLLDPLMGWIGGDDTIQQVELGFPTLTAAIRHAKRLGITYEIQFPPGEAASQISRTHSRR